MEGEEGWSGSLPIRWGDVRVVDERVFKVDSGFVDGSINGGDSDDSESELTLRMGLMGENTSRQPSHAQPPPPPPRQTGGGGGGGDQPSYLRGTAQSRRRSSVGAVDEFQREALRRNKAGGAGGAGAPKPTNIWNASNNDGTTNSQNSSYRNASTIVATQRASMQRLYEEREHQRQSQQEMGAGVAVGGGGGGEGGVGVLGGGEGGGQVRHKTILELAFFSSAILTTIPIMPIIRCRFTRRSISSSPTPKLISTPY